jgi:hypothetical protein
LGFTHLGLSIPPGLRTRQGELFQDSNND